MRKFTANLFILLASFCFSSLASYSQDTTSRGTDFWVGYGHHQFMENGSNAQEMVLYLSTGSQPAVVTITIDSSGLTPATLWQRVYNIPANTVVSIENYPAATYSTIAGAMGPIPKGNAGQYDARLSAPATFSAGLFRKKGIHVESNVPIGVHAHIYGSASSGATIILPVKAWGYTYYSVNSKQSYTFDCYSWLFIIAKEDSTVVEVTPSVLTRSQTTTGLQAGVVKTILLQKGQIYQLMGANDGADANGNGGSASTAKQLTGTKVRATISGRPVAVFSGSSRTGNPASCGSGGGDNDILQLFPIHLWGTKYLTAPTSGSTASSFSTSGYKIVVYDPTTIVKRNGVILQTLINNRYYEFESNAPNYIEADKPVMVAQFMLGGSCLSGSYGDPDMYLLSPLNAGVKNSASIRTSKEAIVTNYLTLIVPTAGLPSLLIDNSSTFNYSYAHPQVPGYSVVVKQWPSAQSQFSVVCDSAFTGIAYGIGPVESYGFNIGARFNPLHGIDSLVRVKWNGTNSTDWRDGGNWSTGKVPAGDEHLLIGAGTPYSLVINDGVEVSCKTIELEAGATMTVKPLARLNVLNKTE